MNFFIKIILCSIMLVFGIVVVYYAAASLLASILSIATWDVVIFKESMLIALEPSSPISMLIRTVSLYAALGGGLASARSLWIELN